jgi:hypothetical protein
VGYLTPNTGSLGVALSADDFDTSTTGVTLTANATPHTKATSYTTIIASTTGDSYGIYVLWGGTAAGTTNTGQLVDIAIGAASSEVIIIPDLGMGYTGSWGADRQHPNMVYFPLYIPAGTRISGRAQAVIASDTVSVKVITVGRSTYGPQFVGQKVTAYGAVSASSRGTLVTAGTSVYGTSAQLTASTADPIKYAQVCIQGGDNTTLTEVRSMLRVMSGTTVLADTLIYNVGGNSEQIRHSMANQMLSNYRLNIPAAASLDVAIMNSSGTEAHDVIVYGVS